MDTVWSIGDMANCDLDVLVGRVQAGATAAYGDVVRSVERDLTLFVAARCPDLDLVEEVVQAALVTAFERIAVYRTGDGTFRSWLKGIARNRLREQLRERTRYCHQQGDRLEALVTSACEHRLEADSKRDDVWATTRQRLASCLATLSPTSRRMLQERYDQGLDIGQLAQHFRRPKRAITTALYRIRQQLKRCLEAPE